MPTKRRRIGAQRYRHTAAMPAGVLWWLRHGQPLGITDARALDLTERDAWQASALHFDRATAERSAFWTRLDCRTAGYGANIDKHVLAGRCPPDDWRTPPRAEVIAFERPSL